MTVRHALHRAEATGLSELQETRIWLIEPSAAPDDSRWQGRKIWQLVVAAPTAAFARLEAERWAQRRRRLAQIGNESPSLNAGFIDEKLYRIQPLPEGVGPRLEEFEAGKVVVLAGPMQSTAGA